MRSLALFALVPLACSVTLPVPTEPMRIESHRHGFYKGGVLLDGWLCRGSFARAVTGVPEAEIERCKVAATVETVGLASWAGLLSAALITNHYEGGTSAAVETELIIAGSFVVGFAAALLSSHYLGGAVTSYNRAVDGK